MTALHAPAPPPAALAAPEHGRLARAPAGADPASAHAAAAARPPAAAGARLGAREVPRHAVRLAVLARDPAALAAGARAPAIAIHPFSALAELLRPGDLVVVNDAATLPASLPGRTAAGAPFELRLSEPVAPPRLRGVLLGAGDWRTRTEARPAPPALSAGARVTLGGLGPPAGLAATVAAARGRAVELVADAPDAGALWRALYEAGTPVQYAHRAEPLALWSVQTAYAARPWAMEMPSAGRALTWDVLLALRRRGVGLAALTHAAGLSSTGDAALDAALPAPEPYEIPAATAAAIAGARRRGGRVIAIGTTVVRALEAARGEAGAGVATLRLSAATPLTIVDGLVSGLHVPGESHFELLSALAPEAHLRALLARAAEHGLAAHELGDACLIAPA